MRTLRPYQIDALAGIRKTLETSASCVCVLPTGTGKTSVASTLMNEWPGGNCLFLAHTRELVDQAAARLAGELGYAPVVEMGIRGGDEGLFWQGGMVVVGSVQSMLTDRRLRKYERNPFDLIVIDECVTGDTMLETDIGKVRIDSLPTSRARSVMTYNGKAVCYRPITDFMPKGVRPVLRIETASGRVIRCTGNHPIYTNRGWVNASGVRVSDSLLCVNAVAANKLESISGDAREVTHPATPDGTRAAHEPSGSGFTPIFAQLPPSANVGAAKGFNFGLARSNHSSTSTKAIEATADSCKATMYGQATGPLNLNHLNAKQFLEHCLETAAFSSRTQQARIRESSATTVGFKWTGLLTRQADFRGLARSCESRQVWVTARDQRLPFHSQHHACPALTRSTGLFGQMAENRSLVNGSMASVQSGLHGGYATTALHRGTGSQFIQRDTRNQKCESQHSGSRIGTGQPASTSGERSITFSAHDAMHAEPFGKTLPLTSPNACTTSFDPVVSIRNDGCEQVYDITVEGTHCFFGNGVLVHNCHRATSRSYRKVVEYFVKLNPNCKSVGLTATPNRADGTALGLVFEAVGYAMDIPDAVSGGWLVPALQKGVVVSDVEITGPTKTNELGEKDFTDSAVEEVMIDEAALRATAEPLVREATGRSTIVFCATVRHAHELAAMLDTYSPGCAAAVDGGTDTQSRADIIGKFRNGDLQFICNAQLFVEGFDAPNCSCVAVARPTKSIGRYTQMVGRALRPLPGVVDTPGDAQDRRLWIMGSDKPNALILDFTNAGAAGLVTIDDVLGGNYDVETRELAAEIRKEGETSVGESLKRAKFLMALEREMEVRAGNRANVQYEVYDRDGRPMATSQHTTGQKRGTITDGQLSFLIALGCDPATATPMSSRQAGVVIDSMKKNRCTSKQANVLKKAGINPNGLGFDHASRIITALAANNWKPLDGSQMNDLIQNRGD